MKDLSRAQQIAQFGIATPPALGTLLDRLGLDYPTSPAEAVALEAQLIDHANDSDSAIVLLKGELERAGIS